MRELGMSVIMVSKMTLQIKWFKTDSEMVLIDRFYPQNCPIKRKDKKRPVLKGIIYPVMVVITQN